MRIRNYLLTICLLISVLAMTACSKDIETGKIEENKIEDKQDKEEDKIIEEEIDLTPVEGGQVILPLTSFSSLNPLMVDNSSYYQFSQLIFEGLFDFDEKLEPQGRLAESYSISENGRVVSIKLRDQVKWHDGQEFTSADVAFTIDTIKQAGNNGSYSQILKSNLGPMENFNIWRAISSKIIDEKNIDIIFQRSYSNKLAALTFPIIPRHIHINQYGRVDYKSALETIDYKPIGTGPYKFVEYENNKNLLVKRNKEYWNGEPYIEEIVGKALGDDKAILEAFETGQVSMAQTEGLDWEKYRQNPRMEVIEYTGSDFLFLGFNFKNKLLTGEKGKSIRRALAYGLDRQSIIEDIYLFHGVEMDIPIHPDSYLVSDEAHSYGYNIDKARDILEDAGYRLNDQGIYQDEKGDPLSLRLVLNSKDQAKLKTMEKIKENLAEVGFDIILENESRPGDFDLILGEWSTSVVTDLSPMFHSAMIRKSTNIINYKNRDLDRALEESLYARDEKEKIQAYERVQSIIIEDLPYIGLIFKNKGLIIDSKIKGPLKPTFYNRYRGLEKCFIPQSLQ